MECLTYKQWTLCSRCSAKWQCTHFARTNKTVQLLHISPLQVNFYNLLSQVNINQLIAIKGLRFVHYSRLHYTHSLEIHTVSHTQYAILKMSGKLELSWKEDSRSIGILEEVEDETKYRPLIMLNFLFIG
jgi:hypothetical protein